VKTAVGSELSLVSGTYHENKVSVVMEMASFCLKIRHVFGFTSLTERGIGAARSSSYYTAQWQDCYFSRQTKIFLTNKTTIDMIFTCYIN
jgi:hypothetical protein